MGKYKIKVKKQKKGLNFKVPNKKTKYIAIALSIIVLFGMVLRFIGFSRPHNFTFDEGLYTQMGHQIMQGQEYSSVRVYNQEAKRGRKLPAYLKQPLFKHPPLYCQMISVFHSLFGPGYPSAVKVSILFGIATIIIVFFIGKLIGDWKVGLLAAGLLAIEPVHWITSQKIWMETTLTFFMTATAFFFLKGLDNEKYFKYAGFMLGGALITKYPGVLAGICIFVYALLVERRLFKNKKFWLIPGIAFLMFLPWLLSNMKVYGIGYLFPGKGVSKELGHVLEISKPFIWGGAFISVVVSALYVVLRKKNMTFFKEKITENTIFQYVSKRKTLLLWIVSAVAFLLCILLSTSFRFNIIHAFSLKYIPENGWKVNQFGAEPWYFYVKRLTMLSPFYFLGYLGVIFYSFKNKKFFYLGFSVFLIFTFFIKWGNYQSRYILPVIPLLMVMTGYIIFKIIRKISEIENKNRRIILSTCFYLFIMIALVKTLQIDFAFVLPNSAAYF
ncbi:glycosyltransferase family 39 protein [Chlamydiota bacterium]